MKTWNQIMEDYYASLDAYYDREEFAARSAHGYGYFKSLAEKFYIEMVYQAHEIASLRQEINEMKADLL